MNNTGWKRLGGLLLVLTSLSVVAKPQDEEHDEMCEAYVYADKAEFLFPVLDVGVWVWNRPESKHNKPEYAWELLIPAQRPQAGLGAYLYKYDALPKQEGTLEQMLLLAQMKAFAIEGEGDNARYRLEPDVRMGVHLEYDGVVLTLDDAASVQRFFAGRPANVRFNLLHPNPIYSIQCEANVNYRSSSERPAPSAQQDELKSVSLSGWDLP